MNETRGTESESSGASREEALSAVFAQMILQQANLALMLLGKTPHPQTGQPARDLEGARMFIDQLEMLEAKTKGNLSQDEQTLLKQSLMSLRLAFVEAVEAPGTPPPGSTPAAADTPPQTAGGATESPPAPETSASEAESKKKFSKKY